MDETRKGFTIVELLVVVLIVGILAVVAVPLMRGRTDASKWSEAKTAMSTIATTLRTHAKGKGSFSGAPTFSELGIPDKDLDGTYFTHECYEITSASAADGRVSFVVTCTATNSRRDEAPTDPPVMTLTCNAENGYVATFAAVSVQTSGPGELRKRDAGIPAEVRIQEP